MRWVALSSFTSQPSCLWQAVRGGDCMPTTLTLLEPQNLLTKDMRKALGSVLRRDNTKYTSRLSHVVELKGVISGETHAM